MSKSILPTNLQREIVTAINFVKESVKWRSNKHWLHLEKRVRLNHLPVTTTPADYNHIIQFIVQDENATVYLFRFDNTNYPVVVTTYEDKVWLAMFGMDGIMETAFPPDRPDDYFQDSRYQLIGKLKDIIK
jgi:hypothetical protein